MWLILREELIVCGHKLLSRVPRKTWLIRLWWILALIKLRSSRKFLVALIEVHVRRGLLEQALSLLVVLITNGWEHRTLLTKHWARRRTSSRGTKRFLTITQVITLEQPFSLVRLPHLPNEAKISSLLLPLFLFLHLYEWRPQSAFDLWVPMFLEIILLILGKLHGGLCRQWQAVSPIKISLVKRVNLLATVKIALYRIEVVKSLNWRRRVKHIFNIIM